MINVLIIEDLHETGAWLSSIVLRAFADANVQHVTTQRDARRHLKCHQVGLALIDINLPDGSGIDLISELRICSPNSYAVIVTIFDDPEHLFPAIKAGANGYILKDQSEQNMVKKLRGILCGDPPLSPSIARKMMEYFHTSQPPTMPVARKKPMPLTPREEEVLVLVARGLSRREIADTLGLSIHTIGRYIKDLYRKIEVTTRAEAAILACQIGLIKLE